MMHVGEYHEYRGPDIMMHVGGYQVSTVGVFSTVGGYHEYCGGVQYRGGYHDTCGGYHDACGGIS